MISLPLIYVLFLDDAEYYSTLLGGVVVDVPLILCKLW